MALKRRQAFSLIEIIVYAGVLLLFMLLVGNVFIMSQKTQRTTASAYAVTGQTDTAIHYLRRDLKETALASVRTYSSGALAPALTFCSPRVLQGGGEGQGKLLLSEYGVPAWSYNVFYSLQRNPGAETSTLVRWEVPLTPLEYDRIPKVATLPTVMDAKWKPRVVLRDVLTPRQTVLPLEGLPSGWVANEWGGFRVQFVRRRGGSGGAESLTDVNPALNEADAADNTRLTEVELAVVEPSMAAPNFYSIKFRVSPRY